LGYHSDAIKELMSLSRKLELSCGLATLLLAIIVSLIALRDDYQTALRLENEFHPFGDFLIVAVRFILPAFLVVLGAYVHAVKQAAWGRVALILGGLFLIGMFLVNLFLSLTFRRTDLWLGLNFLLPVLAIVTILASLLPRREA
jgi:hypothetical protein